MGECPCSKYTLGLEDKFEIKTGGAFQSVINRYHRDIIFYLRNVPAFPYGVFVKTYTIIVKTRATSGHLNYVVFIKGLNTQLPSHPLTRSRHHVRKGQ